MPAVRKTIILIDQQHGWIQAQVQAGHYANENACIRDLIRCDRESSAHLDVLRAALLEGENSGAPLVFDARAFKARMIASVLGRLQVRRRGAA